MSSLADMPPPSIVETIEAPSSQLYAEVSGNQGGTLLRQLRRVTAPTLATTLTESPTPWHPFNLPETYSTAYLGDLTSSGDASLRKQIERLDGYTKRQLDALSTKVDGLARALEALRAPSITASKNEGLPELHLNMAPEDSLVAWFDLVADGGVIPPGIDEVARNSLFSEDSGVRAAAGRALATLDPAAALEMLPSAIEREQNSFTAAILSGALRAARA